MKDIEILKLQQEVLFGLENEYKGRIHGVIIRNEVIMYEIAYWKLDEMKVMQLYEKDFKLVTYNLKTKVGFK
jgi:hypothetical protein